MSEAIIILSGLAAIFAVLTVLMIMLDGIKGNYPAYITGAASILFAASVIQEVFFI